MFRIRRHKRKRGLCSKTRCSKGRKTFPNWLCWGALMRSKRDLDTSRLVLDKKFRNFLRLFRASQIPGHFNFRRPVFWKKNQSFNPSVLATFQDLKNEWSGSRNLSRGPYQILVCHIWLEGLCCLLPDKKVGLPNGREIRVTQTFKIFSR